MTIDTSVFDQISLLLAFLLLFAFGAQEATEVFKPLFVRLLPKDARGDLTADAQQVYLTALFVTRTGSAFILIAATNSYASAVSILPLLGHAPQFVGTLALALVAGTGADAIHTILGTVGAVKTRLENPPTE